MRCRRVCFTRTKRGGYCWIGRCRIGRKSRRRLIAKIGSKGSAGSCREPCRSLSLRSAFRWIAFVPLYRRKALLAGPVHDNKKHANTDRPH
jgi:hypothetical protein